MIVFDYFLLLLSPAASHEESVKPAEGTHAEE